MSIRTLGSACNQAGQVQKYLGTAYDTVKHVADHMDEVSLVSEMLTKYGVLLCFDSAAQLATVDPTLAKYARIYDTTSPLNTYYADYVYQADNLDGLPAKGGRGSWVEMDSLNTVFGEMLWVYNQGAAKGGEQTLTLDIDTLSVTDLYVNGSHQTPGVNFSFNPATQVITLSQELDEGDLVAAKLSGIPALAPGEHVDNYHFMNFVFNDGAARGGELVIGVGIPFNNITSVFRNGARQLYGKDYTYSATSQTITFPVALAKGDVVQATLGGNLDLMSEAAGAAASRAVTYYQLAKDMIDRFSLAVSDAQGFANQSAGSANAASMSEANALAAEREAAASDKHSSAAADLSQQAQAAAESAAGSANAARQAVEDNAIAASHSADTARTLAEAAAKSAIDAGKQADTATAGGSAATRSAAEALASEKNAKLSETNAATSAKSASDNGAASAAAAKTAADAANTVTQAMPTIVAAGEAATTGGATATAMAKEAVDSAAAAKASEVATAGTAAAYANLQSADVTKGDALLAVMQPFTGAVASTQDKRNQQVMYAHEFGILPGGTILQEKFRQGLIAAASVGAEFVLPAGVYTIGGSILVPSNTRFRIEPGASILRDTAGMQFRVMLINVSDGVTGGYGQASNIRIYGGGTIDGNATMMATGISMMAFGHAKDILIEDLYLLNGGSTGHALEFNACQNAIGRRIRTNLAGSNTVLTNEAVQVDAAISSTTFPWFGPYDGTVCDHVIIEENDLQGYGVGIGTNSDATNNHKNIVVRDNKIVANVYGISTMGWDNILLENNDITWGGLGTMVAGIRASFNTNSGGNRLGNNLSIVNNFIHDIVPADLTVDPGTNWYGIKLEGLNTDVAKMSDLMLATNHIENVGNSAVSGQYLSNVLLQGNRLGAPKTTGGTGVEALDLKDCTKVQTLGNRINGSVTVGKGTLAGQLHIVKDNVIGGTLAANTALLTKGSIAGNHAVTAVPTATSSAALVIANNTVG